MFLKIAILGNDFFFYVLLKFNSFDDFKNLFLVLIY